MAYAIGHWPILICHLKNRPSNLQNLLLDLNQLTDTAAPKVQEFLQSAGAERKPFGSTLNFDELVAISHDDVEINISRRVFRIIQVQHGDAINDPHANSGDVRPNRTLLQSLRLDQGGNSLAHGDECARNRRRARTPI